MDDDDDVNASDELRDELRRPAAYRQIPIDLSESADEPVAAGPAGGAGPALGSYVAMRDVFAQVDRTRLYGGALAAMGSSWAPALSGVGRFMQNPLGGAVERAAFPLALSGIDGPGTAFEEIGKAVSAVAAPTGLLDPVDGGFSSAIAAQSAPLRQQLASVLGSWSPTPTEVITGALDQVMGSPLQDKLAALAGSQLVDQVNATWSTTSTAAAVGLLADQVSTTVFSSTVRSATDRLGIVGSVGDAFAQSAFTGMYSQDWRRFAGIDPAAFSVDASALLPFARLTPDVPTSVLLGEELRQAFADLASLIDGFGPLRPTPAPASEAATAAPPVEHDLVVIDQPTLEDLRRAASRVVALATALAATGRRGARRTAAAWLTPEAMIAETWILFLVGSGVWLNGHQEIGGVIVASEVPFAATRAGVHLIRARKSQQPE